MAIFKGSVDQIENTANKVASITADSTNTQYPGAKAVYDLVGALTNNTAGTHNSIFRSKYLGDSVTDAQWAAIQAGTFEDLWIGDYWTINGVNYRIAAFDYYLNDYYGDNKTTSHHVTIVPDTCPVASCFAMDTNGNTNNGYTKSTAKTTDMASTVTAIETAFTAAHVMEHYVALCTAASAGKPTSWSWTKTKVDLMNEVMVFGTHMLSAQGESYGYYSTGTSCLTQLPLFALAPDFINGDKIYSEQKIYGYWLRDIVDEYYFACVDTANGNASFDLAGGAYYYGFRPSFNIC